MVVVEPGAPMHEADTFTCAHCQRVVIVKAGCDPAEAGGFCRVEMKLICGPCADLGTCTPWEKTLEKAEARGRSLRSMGF